MADEDKKIYSDEELRNKNASLFFTSDQLNRLNFFFEQQGESVHRIYKKTTTVCGKMVLFIVFNKLSKEVRSVKIQREHMFRKNMLLPPTFDDLLLKKYRKLCTSGEYILKCKYCDFISQLSYTMEHMAFVHDRHFGFGLRTCNPPKSKTTTTTATTSTTTATTSKAREARKDTQYMPRCIFQTANSGERHLFRDHFKSLTEYRYKPLDVSFGNPLNPLNSCYRNYIQNLSNSGKIFTMDDCNHEKQIESDSVMCECIKKSISFYQRFHDELFEILHTINLTNWREIRFEAIRYIRPQELDNPQDDDGVSLSQFKYQKTRKHTRTVNSTDCIYKTFEELIQNVYFDFFVKESEEEVIHVPNKIEMIDLCNDDGDNESILPSNEVIVSTNAVTSSSVYNSNHHIPQLQPQINLQQLYNPVYHVIVSDDNNQTTTPNTNNGMSYVAGTSDKLMTNQELENETQSPSVLPPTRLTTPNISLDSKISSIDALITSLLKTESNSPDLITNSQDFAMTTTTTTTTSESTELTDIVSRDKSPTISRIANESPITVVYPYPSISPSLPPSPAPLSPAPLSPHLLPPFPMPALTPSPIPALPPSPMPPLPKTPELEAQIEKTMSPVTPITPTVFKNKTRLISQRQKRRRSIPKRRYRFIWCRNTNSPIKISKSSNSNNNSSNKKRQQSICNDEINTRQRKRPRTSISVKELKVSTMDKPPESNYSNIRARTEAAKIRTQLLLQEQDTDTTLLPKDVEAIDLSQVNQAIDLCMFDEIERGKDNNNKNNNNNSNIAINEENDYQSINNNQWNTSSETTRIAEDDGDNDWHDIWYSSHPPQAHMPLHTLQDDNNSMQNPLQFTELNQAMTAANISATSPPLKNTPQPAIVKLFEKYLFGSSLCDPIKEYKDFNNLMDGVEMLKNTLELYSIRQKNCFSYVADIDQRFTAFLKCCEIENKLMGTEQDDTEDDYDYTEDTIETEYLYASEEFKDLEEISFKALQDKKHFDLPPFNYELSMGTKASSKNKPQQQQSSSSPSPPPPSPSSYRQHLQMQQYQTRQIPVPHLPTSDDNTPTPTHKLFEFEVPDAFEADRKNIINQTLLTEIQEIMNSDSIRSQELNAILSRLKHYIESNTIKKKC